MSILTDILKEKRKEVAKLKKQLSFETTQTQLSKTTFRDNVLFSESISIIAEIKRASPSKGVIHKNVDPVTQAKTYEKLGASAISVLTDFPFFHGSFDDLRAVSEAVRVPVLCKD